MLKSIAILLIKIYQKFISPYCPGCCRFIPTCSNYSIEAIKKYGFLKGSWFGAKRISKCNPWGGKGYDPLS